MNSNVNTSQIKNGMDVYGAGGNKIGSVAQVWPNAGQTGTTAGVGATGTAGTTTTAGGAPATPAGTPTGTPMGTTPGTAAGAPTGATGTGGYFKVDQGGVMGIGATELYIPFSAVQSVDAAANKLTLNTTKSEVDSMYKNKPSFLQGS